MSTQMLLKKEADAFDKQILDRINHGFVPDLRRLQKVDWLYNNVWRDPEYVRIHWMPKVNFVLDIAKGAGGKVIELGCGSGYLTLELARNGLDVIGVDLSPKSIEIAKKYVQMNQFMDIFGSLTYECCDFTTLEMGSEEFNTVVFFRTLHHVPDIDHLLHKVHRTLKKEGNLIICEPIRGNFTKESAEVAAIFRAILPTWIPYQKKLQGLCDEVAWDRYVEDIYNEYVYEEEYCQSPLDNSIDSYEKIIETVAKYFEIRKVEFSDAFIDKLIGGLRGKDKYLLAEFLKFVDDRMVKNKILPPTSVCIHAQKLNEVT